MANCSVYFNHKAPDPNFGGSKKSEKISQLSATPSSLLIRDASSNQPNYQNWYQIHEVIEIVLYCILNITC